MEIDKMIDLLPNLEIDEINFIKDNSLNNYFYLHSISNGAFFIPRKGSIYMVKGGGIIIYGYINGYLEFNLDFNLDDCIGLGDLFHTKNIDLMIKGKPEAILLEIPVKKIIEKNNKEVLYSLYEKLITKVVAKTIKIVEIYAAKVTLSNDQYLIKFLLNNGGSFSFESIGELAHILHIELRTLQRLIKKLSSRGIIQKSKKTIKLIDEKTAKKKYLTKLDY